MWLWICMSFVVKKARVKTNVFGFKVNSEGGRVSHGSVICDYAAWLRSSFYNMYTLQSGETSLCSEEKEQMTRQLLRCFTQNY